ncbi:Phosphodiest-domain-containing protein [Lepidopterella palustris CBS 459.81]|uniref:Phosphodiest-domain-containing protein n=1 Tax=Lepidopterella palustris CBS 459.81 TaxID=1314670 RepID=A0A8E2EB17_9PEZI|nr:Phosphodiest-domain-containing protein [Lepidopterella palustris CBS 459.81]
MSRVEREDAELLSGSNDFGDDFGPSTFKHDVHSEEDEHYEGGRPSSEIGQHDDEILNEEDERERLLTGGGDTRRFLGLFSSKNNGGDPIKKGKREKRRFKRESKRDGKHRRHGESSELMYEMEEGVGRSETDSSRNSSESDHERLLAALNQKKAWRARIWRRVIIYMGIVAIFVVIFFVAYRASSSSRIKSTTNLPSNGTSTFAPTTILISLDGFRADFLYRGLTSTLNGLIQEGISPKYMLPSFPSVTFPNHYTMVTGLYPETHGIVSNTFWDPNRKKEFYYTDASRSLQPDWWGGEPIWVTAEKQRVRTAIHMWPGSEAHIGGIEPTYMDKYNGSELLPQKVNRILELLDLPGPDSPAAKPNSPRPQLIAAYVPVVDSDGHKYGPNSTEIRQTISDVDNMLSEILHGLQERNLTEIVNVVVVSDHGMATTSVDRLIQFEDLVDPDELEHIDGWPLYGLRLKNPDDLDRLHQQLQDKAKDNPNFEVYLKDKDMPERYHFSQNERIAPLWIVPKTGWAIVTRDEFDVEEGKRNGDVYHPRGLHGYDHEHPLMRAIFVARGPAFPHKPNSRVEPFQNIELYNIVCDSIGVTPKSNNGTLRLPLKPVGLHSDPELPGEETPPDPVESVASVVPSSPASPSTPPSPSSPFAPASPSAPASPPTPAFPSAPASPATPSSPAMQSSPASLSSPAELSSSVALSSTILSTVIASATPSSKHWWEWVTDKVDEVEEWVDDLIQSFEKKPPNGGHGGGR